MLAVPLEVKDRAPMADTADLQVSPVFRSAAEAIRGSKGTVVTDGAAGMQLRLGAALGGGAGCCPYARAGGYEPMRKAGASA